MPNTLTGRNLDLTQHIRDHVESKVERLRKLFSTIQQVDVVLAEGKRQAIADLFVLASHGSLKCQAKDATPSAAFDVAIDKMERQLHRHKARLTGNKKHLKDAPRHSLGRAALAGPQDTPFEEAEENELPELRSIRARAMSSQEAVDAFSRSEESVLIYQDESTSRHCVLCWDGDGEMQILEIVSEA